ncbi:MAG: energy-coupling factor transporter transmembrane component T [Eubacteriales bacterium]|nr:energy-coupling factor transporter transmembrane component T [Eubacteriales bacterium]
MPHLRVKTPLYPIICILSGLLIFFTGLLFVKQPWFPLYLLAVALLYTAFGYFFIFMKAALIFAVIGGITFGLTVIFWPTENALQNFYRIFILGISAVPTISLPPIHLVRCMNQLHVPRWLTIGLLICIRFFYVMGTEIARIRMAMRVRNIRGAWHPKVWYRAVLIPFMMRLFSISDMLALSLETRAFSMRAPASIYRRIHVRGRDILYFGLLVGIICVGFVFKIQGVPWATA